MELQYAIDKLKKMTNIDDLSSYENDIKKLVDAHNSGILVLYPRFKLLSQQILLGLDSPYERIIKSLKYGKDSASLEVFTLKYGEIEGLKRFNDKKSKSVHTLETYIARYGEEDGPIKFKEYCKSKSMSLEMCIKRHGEIEGPIVYKKFWSTTTFGTNERAFKLKYGKEWEKHFEDFRISQGRRSTLEGKIEKYGKEEGTRRFNEMIKKISKSSSKKFFIKKLLKSVLHFKKYKKQ